MIKIGGKEFLGTMKLRTLTWFSGASLNKPGKPSSVKGTPANGKIFVNGVPPVGPTPDSYNAIARPTSPPGADVTANASPTVAPDGTVTIAVSSLTNGTVYDVFLQAVSNTLGNSDLSDASAPNQNITPFGFALTDLGANYFRDYDADSGHITVSGGFVQSMQDQSGNSQDLSFASGTKWTVFTGYFNGKDGLQLPNASGGYHNTHSDAVGTGFEVYATLVNSGVGGYDWSLGCMSDGVGSPANSDAIGFGLTNGSLTNGAPRGTIVLNTSTVDTTRASGHQFKQWKNGDQSTTGDATIASLTTPNTVLVWGASVDGATTTGRSNVFRRIVYINGTLTNTQRQQVEGILAWDFPSGHNLLPNTHPYYASSPTGNFVAPGVASAVYARPNGTSGSVTVYFTPGDEGGLQNTYTSTSSPGSITTSNTPTTVSSRYNFAATGLTNATAYTFTITPQNGAGTNSASSASTRSATPINDARADSLVCQYRCDEASGNLLDSWYSGYDLTAHGSPGTDGAGGRTFGGSDWFVVPVVDNLQGCNGTDFTIDCTFKPTDLSGNHQNITIRNTGGGTNINAMMRTEGTNLVGYVGNGIGSFSPFTLAIGLSTGTTYTARMCVDKTTKAVRWSVNGGTVGSDSSGTVPSTISGLNFGVGGVDSSETFKGTIYTARVVFRKFSDSELQSGAVEF